MPAGVLPPRASDALPRRRIEERPLVAGHPVRGYAGLRCLLWRKALAARHERLGLDSDRSRSRPVELRNRRRRLGRAKAGGHSARKCRAGNWLSAQSDLGISMVGIRLNVD